MKKYRWYCKNTGEIQDNLRHVLHVIYFDHKYYGIWDFSWRYSFKGF